MWFDVGIKRYTTHLRAVDEPFWLWFDVGIKRYTTPLSERVSEVELWFDVGIKRYTTVFAFMNDVKCCGLM